MADIGIETTPTSTAATGATEPEVVAAISSAEGDPDTPTDIRVGGAPALGPVALAAMFVGGALLGVAAALWLRPRA